MNVKDMEVKNSPTTDFKWEALLKTDKNNSQQADVVQDVCVRLCCFYLNPNMTFSMATNGKILTAGFFCHTVN